MKKIKLKDLTKRFEADAEENNISHNIIANSTSTLNVYVKFCGKNSNDFVSSLENFVDFKKELDKEIEQIWSGKTVPGKKSIIKKFRQLYKKMIVEKDAEIGGKNFGEVLKYFRELKGIGKKELVSYNSIKGKISSSTINKWEGNTSRPQLKNYPVVEEIEKILNCEGFLTSLLNKKLLRGNTKNNKIERSKRDSSKKGRFNLLYSHLLKRKFFPQEMQQELEEFIEYKTVDDPPIGLKRNGEKISPGRTEKLIGAIEGFFGFLTLPRDTGNEWMSGMGIDKNKIYLSMLANPEYSLAYKKFLSIRNKYGAEKDSEGNVHVVKLYEEEFHTKHLYNSLGWFKSLVEKPTGYFYQREALKRKFDISKVEVKDYTTGEEISWKEYCENTYWHLVQMLQIKTRKVRNTKEPVKHLISGEMKAKIISEIFPNLIKDIEAFIPKSIKEGKRIDTKQLVWIRRHLLTCFSYANPLRITQMSKLTFSIKNRDAHVVKIGGIWTWNISKEEFKNAEFLEEDYYVKFPQWLNTIFENYLKYRELMVGGKLVDGAYECDYIFRPCVFSSSIKDITNPINSSAMKKDALAITALLDDCYGFGAHVFRLLISTGAKFFGGLKMSAGVINDSEEITEEFYTVSDRIDEVQEYFGLTEKFMTGKPNKKNNKGNLTNNTKELLKIIELQDQQIAMLTKKKNN